MQKLVVALLTATIAVCGAASAQTKIDPQADQFTKAFAQVMNSRNADRGIALLTADAILIDPFGKASTGRQAERHFFELAFKLNPNATFMVKPIASRAGGNTMWIVGDAAWTPTAGNAGAKPVETHAAYVLVRRGGGWKLQMLSVGFNGQSPGAR